MAVIGLLHNASKLWMDIDIAIRHHLLGVALAPCATNVIPLRAHRNAKKLRGFCITGQCFFNLIGAIGIARVTQQLRRRGHRLHKTDCAITRDHPRGRALATQNQALGLQRGQRMPQRMSTDIVVFAERTLRGQ